jgi:hypothetical protein
MLLKCCANSELRILNYFLFSIEHTLMKLPAFDQQSKPKQNRALPFGRKKEQIFPDQQETVNF